MNVKQSRHFHNDAHKFLDKVRPLLQLIQYELVVTEHDLNNSQFRGTMRRRVISIQTSHKRLGKEQYSTWCNFQQFQQLPDRSATTREARKLARTIKPLTFIRETPVSKLGQGILRRSLQFLQANVRIVPSVRPRPLPTAYECRNK